MDIFVEDYLKVASSEKLSKYDNDHARCFSGVKQLLRRVFVEKKCTETSLFVFNCAIGVSVMLMQVVPIGMQTWIQVVEPRAVNLTDDKGEQMELPFTYSAGYFKICRSFEGNLTSDLANIAHEKDFVVTCHWNPLYNGVDLTDYSFATVAILIRLLVPTIMHIVGAAVSTVGFVCSVMGFAQKNGITVVSAIFYIFGGLTVSMAVLQFVSIVDDEMQPRMKPNAAGEPSSFSYTYDISFFVSALSFIPAQVCIYLQTQMYFSRYPKPDDKTKAVPGLNSLLAQARKKDKFCFRSDIGTSVNISTENNHEKCYFNRSSRRGTRNSRDFTTYGIQREYPLSPPLTASSIPSQFKMANSKEDLDTTENSCTFPCCFLSFSPPRNCSNTCTCNFAYCSEFECSESHKE